MDNRSDGLWQGGPWEQPARPFSPPPAVVIPPQKYRPPRPPQRRHSGRIGFSHRAGFDCLPHRPCSLVQWRPRPPFRGPRPLWVRPGIQQLGAGGGPLRAPFHSAGGDRHRRHPLHHSPSGEALTYTQVYEKAAPSIAALTAYSAGMVSTGTGIVLTADGYIVTNAHIIAGAEQVNVTLSDDSLWSAQLVGFEPLEDLAVLKIDAPASPPPNLAMTPCSAAETPSPPSATPWATAPPSRRASYLPWISRYQWKGPPCTSSRPAQPSTTAAPGGALLNDRGQVVGVTTIKIVADDGSAEGLGFAIPTTRVKQVVDRLIAGAPVTRPSLGIIVRRGQGENGGLVVEEVDPDSDCHRQGIQPQDIIVAANGQQVQTFADLERIKRTLDVGDSPAPGGPAGRGAPGVHRHSDGSGRLLTLSPPKRVSRSGRYAYSVGKSSMDVFHSMHPATFPPALGRKSPFCSPQPLTYKGCGDVISF